MKNKGFTLIELLVVLSIIGILAFFLVPKLFMVQDRAKETAVKAVMHDVQLAIESYNLENEIYPIATNLSLKELCENYLMAGGYISAVPKNPYMGKEYSVGDTSGKIIYNYDSESGVYSLTGYKRYGRIKLLELKNM